MNQLKKIFFIALLPPLEIQDQVTQIKQHFSDRYTSSHALKSPPHITLQPPFEWSSEQSLLQECLISFANTQESIPIILNGFSSFPPRVIYINVIKTPELLKLQADLIGHLETLKIIDKPTQIRAFTPHMTVAFRDLTKQNFKAAWHKFQQRQLHFKFAANCLTLLQHDGLRWNILTEFPFFKQQVYE